MGKYFKYAIGEILLVVIGILIALQINNWNEARKSNNQEIRYYCQLVNDVEADLANVDTSIKSLDDKQNAAKRLLKNLLKIQDDKATVIKDYLPAVRSIEFIPTKAAIEDITSSGKLENFKNQNHKNAILSYYVLQNSTLQIIVSNRNNINQMIFDYDNFTDFGINELPLYQNLYDDELQELLHSREWQKDPNDPLFKHLMDHMNMTVILCEREKDILLGIKQNAEELIDLIKSNCR